MTKVEIINALNAKKSVKWENDLYDVILHTGKLYIVCSSNDDCVLLTDANFNSYASDIFVK